MIRASARTAGLAACLYALPAFAEEDVGFPQLKQTDTFAGQVLWLAVAFCLMFALMSKLALPRVGNVLDARKQQRQGDLDEAERASAEAEKVRKSFEASLAKAQEAAQAHLASAGQDISAKIAEDTSKFGESARKRVAAAEQGIAKAKQDALGSLADISAELAADMAGKIAGLQVGKAEAKQAVASLLQKAS